MSINIEALPYAELIELQANVNKQVEIRRIEEKAKVIEQMQSLASSNGFTVAELLGVGGKLKGKKRAASLETYRNPNDHSQTWAGRGRKPQWLNDAVANGKSLDDFKV